VHASKGASNGECLKEASVLFQPTTVQHIYKHSQDCTEEVNLTFRFKLGDDDLHWFARMYPDGRLMVDVPYGCMPEGSREGFVALMEFAEEQLDCDEIFVRIQRDRQDRARLLRTFSFFGFALQSPERLPAELKNLAKKHLIMACKVE